MASNTPNLNLLKKDPVTDGNDTFNIRTMLNDNWDKIDAAVGNMDIPDASLTVKGKVQLSSATDSSAEDKAATPKAVKDVALEAKSYTDQQINLVTETGIPKLVSYPLKVTATVDNQTVFEIPLDLFDANTDTLLVAINRAALDPTQYTVTNTVRNGAGEVTQRAKITLISGVAATSEVTMVVLKNVPLGEDGAINGAVLAVDSVPINRVNGLQRQLEEAFQAGNERKEEVVAALVALGVSASTSETWAQLIPKMSAIIRATGNATAADLLANKTASNINGPFTGTMADRGGAIIIPSGTAAVAIPDGAFKGAKVAQVSVPAAKVLNDTTIAGVTGMMANQGSKSATLTAQSQQFTIPAGFHDGTGKITAQFANLVAGNVKTGVNIGGVDGTVVPSLSGSSTINFSRSGQRPYLESIITIPAGVSFISFNSTMANGLLMYHEINSYVYLVISDGTYSHMIMNTDTASVSIKYFNIDLYNRRVLFVNNSGAAGYSTIPANLDITKTLTFLFNVSLNSGDPESNRRGYILMVGNMFYG
ncbi:phage tail protein [Fontibacillus sp. BL9]|uniref:phage tail protein n=1 Tax=Fontibacillus sp. BL9 TaxID=3389971 RepID=UPI003978840E